MNIPYIANPKAIITDSGRIPPNIAPRNVPNAHPIYGNTPRPKKKDLETFFCVIATAKISSVIKKPNNHLYKPLNLESVF